jgi:transposase InsO family protein
VWLRNGLETRHRRLLRLEQHAQEDTFVLSEEQIELLERHSVDFRCRHVESAAPGQLLNQDTFYWGTLKGVGKVYVQVVVDTFCSLAFAKVYTSKMPITACDLLYERVLPFYEALGVEVGAILTDNGREFCGKPDSHPFELLLGLEEIEHRTTKVRSPQSRVGCWRGTCRRRLAVAPRFRWECLTIGTMGPFPAPARRTVRAAFPHTALVQNLMASPSAGRRDAWAA